MHGKPVHPSIGKLCEVYEHVAGYIIRRTIVSYTEVIYIGNGLSIRKHVHVLGCEFMVGLVNEKNYVHI